MQFVLSCQLIMDKVTSHLLFGWIMFIALEMRLLWTTATSKAGKDTIVVILKMLELCVKIVRA